MARVRTFKSALNDVTYAAGRPLTVGEFIALPDNKQRALQALCRG